MVDVGDRIKFRRKELGLTQIQLAERLGLTSKAAISTVEHNKEDMTLDRVKRYAQALNTTPAYLMGWSDSHEHYYVSGKLKKIGSSDDKEEYTLDVSSEFSTEAGYERYRRISPYIESMNGEGFEKLMERAEELEKMGYTKDGDT